MTEKKIIYILQNKNLLLKTIQAQRKMICEQILEFDERIKALVLHGKDFSRIRNSSGGTYDQMLSLLEEEQRIAKEEILSMEIELDKMTKKEKEINRVWVCFRAIPLEEFKLLEALFVKRIKWDYLIEKELSRTQIFKIRKRGLQNILKLFQSDLTLKQILKYKDMETQEILEKQEDNEKTEQLSIIEYLRQKD